MLPKDKKTGLSRLEFYGAVVLLAAALCGIWKYGIYSKPTVLSSSALPALPLGAAQTAPSVTASPSTSSPPGTGQSASSAAPPPPTEWQKMSVTVEGNTGGLLTTLATALFGAIGWLAFDSRNASKNRPKWAAFLAAFCTGISLFFGAASQGHLVAMLSRGDFNPYDRVYMLLNLGQFGFLGAGACFLIGFAMYDLREGN